MSMIAVEFDPEFEFRPADWRLRLARLVVTDAVPPGAHRYVDDLVQRAARVIAGRADPIIQAVIELHDNGPLIDRAELTARVITRQSANDIAEATSRPRAFVDMYEQIAFEYRGQRTCPPGIPGLNLLEPIAEDDLEAVLNRVAFHGKLPAVEAIAPYLRSGLRSSPASESNSDKPDHGQLILGIYAKMVRLLIEPVDLVGTISEMRQQVASGVPHIWDPPLPRDALTTA